MGNMIKIMKGLLVLFLASLVIAVGGPAAAQTWTELAPSGGPPPGRIWPTVVHNQDNNRMVVFGGSNATQIFFVPPSVALLNDTWVLSNADGTESSPPAWTQLTANGAAGSPSKRAGHSAIFDKASNRMIVFGGNPTIGFCNATTNDLWLLTNADGTGGTPTWTQLSPSGGPPSPRWVFVSGYDSANNRMIVFGGNQACVPLSANNNHIWVLQNANGLGGTPTWAQFFPTGTPPPIFTRRTGAYDPSSNRLIVLGRSSSSASGMDDVRVLTNANGLGGTPNWVPLSPTGGPPTTLGGHSVVYDPTTNSLIVFGGSGTGPGGKGNDVWVLSNANGLGGAPAWTQLNPTGGPPSARDNHGAAYNVATNRMMVFGGTFCLSGGSCTTQNDSWVLAGATATDPVDDFIAQLEADLAAALAEIENLQNGIDSLNATIAGLNTQIGQLQGDLAAANTTIADRDATIADLQTQVNSVNGSTASLDGAFQQIFSDPSFQIPGATTEEKIANLISAIQRLNRGRQQGLYVNLGGTNGSVTAGASGKKK